MRSRKDLLDCREPVSQLPNQCVHTKQINKRFFVDESSSWYCFWCLLAHNCSVVSFSFWFFFLLLREASVWPWPHTSHPNNASGWGAHNGTRHNYILACTMRGMFDSIWPDWSQNEIYNFFVVCLFCFWINVVNVQYTYLLYKTISGRHMWSDGTCNISTPPYSRGSHFNL